jgi:hypothetical protein
MNTCTAQIVSEIVNAVSTLTECIKFQILTNTKASKSNTLKYKMIKPQRKDALSGDLSLLKPDLIGLISEFYKSCLDL